MQPAAIIEKLKPIIQQLLGLAAGRIHVLATTLIISLVIALIIWLVIRFFFCLSLFSAYKLVPQENKIFPAWFCWMLLIPFVCLAFEWIMLPFGIPDAFKKYLSDNRKAKRRIKFLFGLGLAFAIVGSSLFFLPLIISLCFIARFILFVVYWIKIVTFKNRFLLNK